jgi:Tfp pilus assembly protein PilO
MMQGQIPQPPDVPFDPNLFVTGNGPPLVLLIVVVVFTAATIILWPIMRALGRRLENKGAGVDTALRAEVEHLQQRIADLEPMQTRVAELEERLDFAERLLAQAKDPERLPR